MYYYCKGLLCEHKCIYLITYLNPTLVHQSSDTERTNSDLYVSVAERRLHLPNNLLTLLALSRAVLNTAH